MTPYYEDDLVTLHHGDCVDVMATMEPDSVDAVVCDPPYELGFMGRPWDASGVAYRPETWAAALRVLKPGGHLLAFGGTRTYHRMTVAVEDAGLEIRDCIAWMYGSGFPKSLDVSKAIDKAEGAEREVVGSKVGQPGYSLAPSRPEGHTILGRGLGGSGDPERESEITAPATDEARRWSGWGTALKPAHEPIVVARKPLTGTVAANVLVHGTGALNIDATRVSAGQDYLDKCASVVGLDSNRNGAAYGEWTGARQDSSSDRGRWPANVVLDPEAGTALDRQSGTIVDRNGGTGGWRESYVSGTKDADTDTPIYRGEGGASRFFYCAKASKADRGPGNDHPTVKPVELMRWLVRLVTPPGGTVLDPFAGSGTTLVAAVIEGFHAVGIEREDEYARIIRKRLTAPIASVLDFGGAA